MASQTIRYHLRAAFVAQLAIWGAVREIEKELDRELTFSDGLESLASTIDDADDITDEFLDEAMQHILEANE